MCADDGAVDDRADVIDLELQLLEDGRPVASSRPVVEAIVDGLPRPEPFRQVTPWHACFRPEEYRFDELSISQRGCRTGLLFGQDLLQPTPMLLGKRVSTHPDF